MKVTKLNINCLEKILKYLSYNDLLNVAESNSHLRNVARVVYRLKYRTTKVFIIGIKLSAVRLLKFTDVSDKRVKVSDLKTGLRLLRHFGDSISTVSVNQPGEELAAPKYTSEFYDISYACLIAYINQYCCESLTRINFAGTFSLGFEFNKTLEWLKWPFLNVHTIELGYGFVWSKNSMRLFPNIRNLLYNLSNFDHTECVRLASIKCHFPYLESLGIGFIQGKFFELKMTDPKCMRMVSHLNSILRLNPQIQNLVIPFFMDETFLQGISEHLQRLKNLSFVRAPANFAQFNGHFKNLKRFEVCYENHIYANNMASNHVKIERLEEFNCFILTESDNEFYDFIARHPSIMRLSLCSAYAFKNEITATYLANALPKLNEIDFRKCKFTIDDPLSFIRLLKSLKKFSFRFAEDAENKSYEYLVKSLPNGWHATKHRQHFSFGSEFVTIKVQN